ncbi:MAG: MBL fold metallo-hydrolase [Hyphomicrobiaceae bacterium]|nr:MAG: MBL fold metallo-hydrolase [Hyphomicrobiaceae bacterium]
MALRISLHGGFGEKGRTSLAIHHAGYSVLFDCGINTSDRATWYPAISRAELARLDALVITHAHEDHAAALGWCLANGFAGRILMTPEARSDAEEVWAAYATPEEYRLASSAEFHSLPMQGRIALGPFSLTTGRSGHVVGGVWCHVAAGGTSLLYCGDLLPHSPLLPFDPMPPSRAIALDISYGADDVPLAERVGVIRAFVAAHPTCILPTPQVGRSLELFALLDQPMALAPGMRDALAAQIRQQKWLAARLAPHLAAKLDQAKDWQFGQPFPDACLLCQDGMGMAGPSREILAEAERIGHPVLLTGHLPAGSPGSRMLDAGRAQWARLPTHPTVSENRALLIASGAQIVLGHSCSNAVLEEIAPLLPGLRRELRSGQLIQL